MALGSTWFNSHFPYRAFSELLMSNPPDVDQELVTPLPNDLTQTLQRLEPVDEISRKHWEDNDAGADGVGDVLTLAVLLFNQEIRC